MHQTMRLICRYVKLTGDSMQKIVKFSWELSVLMQYVNAKFALYILTLEVLGIVTVVVNATFTVTHHSPRAAAISTTLLILTLHSYKNFGNVYEESSKSLRRWSSSMVPAKSAFSKFCRAYRPLRVRIGRFYYADRSLMLTILSIILVNTANLALTARNN